MIQQFLGRFDWIFLGEIVVKILAAVVLGGIVGMDRERRNMPAGLRTYMLVSVGSCIFTLLSRYGFPDADQARIAAQIVSGIGFLGAGLMVQRRGMIYGLTSAAGIWAVAAVGMATGTGNYFIATVGAIFIYVVLAILRRWSKADLIQSTRRTLDTALRQVRDQIKTMGDLSGQALERAVEALIGNDQELARQIIDEDAEINDLRYRIEEECLVILRAHHPHKIQLRTVLAATHIATSLERIGDYAREIAQIRLQVGDNALFGPTDILTSMASRTHDLLVQAVTAFARDDVTAAEQIGHEVVAIDQQYEEVVEAVTDRMTDKKTKHFERGATALNAAYQLKRAGERVTSIVERIVFVRTGALAELEEEA